jgi:hypothetical protein
VKKLPNACAITLGRELPGHRLRRWVNWIVMWLSALFVMLAAMPFQASARGDSTPLTYSLDSVVYIREGYVAEATWLDANQYIYLAVSPDGAAVWRYNYADSTKERFISANFIEQYLCPAQYAARLQWTLSPSKHLLFTHYFDDAGQHHWNLLDITSAPNFRLKNFTPPAGMQISQALFSPDDHYGVFIHDSFQSGSDTSVLVLDFATGSEYWRIGAHELSFISKMWWGAAIYDAPRCTAVAQLHNGGFREHEGLAKLDLSTRTITFTDDAGGVLLGSEALWGEATCRATGNASQPYELTGHIPSKPEVHVPLTAQPVAVDTLPQAGLVLIANTADQISTDLWLVDIINNGKRLVDQDCASYSLASDGKLLVRGEKNNALRVYTLGTDDGSGQGTK